MRPDLLNPLFAEATSLKGVGAGLARPLDKLGLTRVRDFLYHLPDRFVERRAVPTLAQGQVGEQIVIMLTVLEHRQPAGRGPFRVIAADSAGETVSITYFGRASYTARKALPVGETRWVAGRLDQFGPSLQIVHPDHVSEDGGALMGHLVEPVYPLSEGLTQGRINALVQQALGLAPELPEWIEPGLKAREEWPSWREAMLSVHKGQDKRARDRLAYDELFANALALMLVREANRKRAGQALHGDGHLRDKLNLPFTLTGAQTRAIGEIEGDMAQGSPMLRLLQGDVGSGKTAVALHAMLIAVEAGAGGPAGAHRNPRPPACRYFGEDGAGHRRQHRAAHGPRQGPRARGAVDEPARWRDRHSGRHPCDLSGQRRLSQPRAGGDRRAAPLWRGAAPAAHAKARRTPHCLAMTATPIPRTLTLAQYGEMEVSRLDEMPPVVRPSIPASLRRSGWPT
jgi:ATP-dependent DNA helicase RecG